MASESSVSKTIRLTDLVPANYRLWAAQTEATFTVHGVLDIVIGERLRPGDVRQASQAIKWDRQHALARQALTNPGAISHWCRSRTLKSNLIP